MSHSALFFFPHNPWPPRTGAHRRALQILAGMGDLGYRVILASTPLYSDNRWEPKSKDELVRQGLVDEVRLYRPTPHDLALVTGLGARHRLASATPPIDSAFYTPPGLLQWFSHLAEEMAPRVIVVNYVHWGDLASVPAALSCHRVIETHDLISLNRAMQAALVPHLTGSTGVLGTVRRVASLGYSAMTRGAVQPLVTSDLVADEVLREDFFEQQRLAPDPREFRILDRFDHTIAITPTEAALMREHTARTCVSSIPISFEPQHIPNTFAGPALFAVGPNPFNLQGYLYFKKRVLPSVLRQAPSFTLDVSGSWYMHLHPLPEQGIRLRGFVPSLAPLYAAAPFAICPVLGGTGQQVKIVEAMAHGVPVIALKAAADRSPIRHGLNGMVARDAREFADHVVRLWNDRALCRRLGEAARDTIASEYSRQRLTAELSLALSGRFPAA
jgi:Glycosyl transferases group 1